MADAPKRKRLEKTVPDTPAISNQKFYCCRCGTAFSRQKGFFPVSHSPMYRGTGYLPFCSDCVDELYEIYRDELADDRQAMRRVCMKLDLYWNDTIYDMVERTAGVNSRVRCYIGKTNIIRYIDKTFDDTLREEARNATTPELVVDSEPDTNPVIPTPDEPEEEIVIPDDVALFWGPGYTPFMYMELEQRRKYWMSRFPNDEELDIGTEALIRQICSLEIDINKARTDGKPIDKYVNSLNTILGSLNLKPVQNTQTASAVDENTPFGVWIKRWEDQRPVPEPDPELQDVDGIIRYIDIWFRGHLAKMVGLKTATSRLYEEKLEEMRIERPEYEDEDDEAMFYDIFSGGDGSDE